MPPIHAIDCGNRPSRIPRLLMIAGDLLIGTAVIGTFVAMIGWCLFAEVLS